MSERTYCVYMHTNKINGKKYIGQTCQKPEDRFRKDGIGYIGSRVFYNAIRKYGWNNFYHEILFTNLTLEQANIVEQALIFVYKTTDRRFGYNLESGGKNHIMSEESKELLRQSKKGTQNGVNNPFYGKRHTTETRKKLSESHKYIFLGENNPNYGKKHTAESKEKMATSGAKVQENFIEYVQKQTGVNLASARDTQFDTRSYFNIDTRQLGNNDLRTVQSLMRQYDGGYDVTIADNGAHRKAIYVKRKKK